MDSPTKLALGLGTGLAFGWFLQRGRASDRRAIVGQLRLRDWDVVKIMATASAVGGLGSYALRRADVVDRQIKPLRLGGVLAGGALFGAGLAALGYCPGTSVAAMGEGKRDAAVGVGGMLVGALAFVALLPRIAPLLEAGDLGERTVPEALTARSSPGEASSGERASSG